MLDALYNTGLFFYHSFIRLCAGFHTKAKLFSEGRREWKKQLDKKIFTEYSWAWFHCASLGEFEDGKTFISAFRNKFPQYKILITFQSPSGYELRHNSPLADHVMYLPADYTFSARYFVNSIHLKCVFFVRNDLWRNYLKVIKEKKIPLFFLSCLISEDSGFLKHPLRNFYRECFSCFDAVFAQTNKTQQLLSGHYNIRNIYVTGNTRIDAVAKNPSSNKIPEGIEKFAGGNFCVTGGSLLDADIDIFMEAYRASEKNIRWILVPHEIKPKQIGELLKKTGNKAILYSEIKNLDDHHRLLIVDCVGVLRFIYRYSQFSYIGGGFNKIGIHNILEPCAFGSTIVTGPNTRHYPEAVELSRLGVCSVISHANNLQKMINEYFDAPEKIASNKIKAEKYISDHIGATDKALEICARLLSQPESVAVEVN
jgi:3-deoxy-D-manno-octulosonic-acid transferase